MASRFTRSTLILLFLTFLVATPVSFPVGISYTVSDSMAPTLGVNDGFVRVPAGNIEPGEIVVFESPSREREYTVHRVVKETPSGFVTKGDNNEITDQAAGYPSVQREDIHGKVLTIAGSPVVIPNLGVLIRFVQEYQTLLLVVLAGLLLLDTMTTEKQAGRPIRAGHALGFVTIVAIVALVLIVLLGGTTAELTFVAVEDEATASHTVPVGEPTNKTVQVNGVSRTPLTYYAVDASGLAVTDRTWNDSTFVLSTVIPPRQTTGVHETTVAIHAYPVSLPPSLIERLHAIHPALAALVTALAAIGPWYLLGWFVIDPKARLREGTGIRRLRRRLRRWD